MAVGVAAGAAARQAGIGQRLEPQAGQPLRLRLERGGVGRQLGVRARREHRSIRLRGEADAVGRRGVARREHRPGAIGGADLVFPGALPLGDLGRGLAQHAFQPLDLGLQRRPLCHLLRRRQLQLRLVEAGAVARGLCLVGRVGEEREEPEVVLLAERIVLVVVALRAAQRGAEPHRRRRVGAIDEHLVHRLVGIDAALLVGHRVAMEAGGDALRLGRVGQHVAGDLLDREAIEGHVGVERVDHPVAVLPDVATLVLLVAVGVGVAGEVEPRPGPALAVARRGEQAIDDALVGAGLRVRGERVDLGGRRRQAGEVEGDAPQQRLAIGLGRRRQLLVIQPRENEPIDRRAHPGLARDGRQRRTHRLDVGPVLGNVGGSGAPGRRGGHHGARGDPAAQRRQLGVAQRIGVERHAVLAVEAEDAPHQQALLGVAGDHHRPALAALGDVAGAVQPQPAARLLGAVALVAVLLEQRLDVTREVDTRGRRLRGGLDGRGFVPRRRAQRERREQGHRAADEEGGTASDHSHS